MADVAQMVRHAGRFGIGAEWAGADLPAIRDRVTPRQHRRSRWAAMIRSLIVTRPACQPRSGNWTR